MGKRRKEEMTPKLSDNEIKILEFETTISKIGNSAHVILPKNFIGKRVKIRIEEID